MEQLKAWFAKGRPPVYQQIGGEKPQHRGDESKSASASKSSQSAMPPVGPRSQPGAGAGQREVSMVSMSKPSTAPSLGPRGSQFTEPGESPERMESSYVASLRKELVNELAMAVKGAREEIAALKRPASGSWTPEWILEGQIRPLAGEQRDKDVLDVSSSGPRMAIILQHLSPKGWDCLWAFLNLHDKERPKRLVITLGRNPDTDEIRANFMRFPKGLKVVIQCNSAATLYCNMPPGLEVRRLGSPAKESKSNWWAAQPQPAAQQPVAAAAHGPASASSSGPAQAAIPAAMPTLEQTRSEMESHLHAAVRSSAEGARKFGWAPFDSDYAKTLRAIVEGVITKSQRSNIDLHKCMPEVSFVLLHLSEDGWKSLFRFAAIQGTPRDRLDFAIHKLQRNLWCMVPPGVTVQGHVQD